MAETLPWRYDFENMPKDGSPILVKSGVLYDVVYWAAGKFEGEVFGPAPDDIPHKYFQAFLPITPPSKEVVS